ncbi:MAG: shikimate kinase, partial [Sphingobacteriaceae bacterium]|nr:shikimate kinase [Sphingobacteriaceae bacterium]
RQMEMSITEYFEKFGEEKFRKLESDILKKFDYPEKCVVATGGGLPCFFDNMDWMNQNGTTIYLQMEPTKLVTRLHNRSKRPLIKDMDDETLLTFIKNKLQEREVFYSKAKHTIDSFDLTAEQMLEVLK